MSNVQNISKISVKHIFWSKVNLSLNLEYIDDKNPANNFGKTPFHSAARATCSHGCPCLLMKEKMENRSGEVDENEMTKTYMSGEKAFEILIAKKVYTDTEKHLSASGPVGPMSFAH